MYGRRFFASKLGFAAAVSIAAMAAFNIMALTYQLDMTPRISLPAPALLLQAQLFELA